MVDPDVPPAEPSTTQPQPARESEFVENEVPRAGTPVTVVPYDPGRTREWIRGGLALGLAGLMAAVILMVVWATLFHAYDTKSARDLIGLVLTPLIGLVGAATGFYYGGDRALDRGSSTVGQSR